MAKQCEVCAKSTVAGKRIQHHHSIGWRFRAPRTNRTFKPNLKVARVQFEEGGDTEKVKVCMKCYKRLRKEGKVPQYPAK
jgi:large subunit ribosomal protein L28